jgi:hypothetical protein
MRAKNIEKIILFDNMHFDKLIYYLVTLACRIC